MKRILLYIWQLPQNLVGLFLLGFYKIIGKVSKWTPIADGVNIYLSKHMPSGISLGNYIIFKDRSPYYYPDILSIQHEYGHHKQSLYLGPLYLLVIGLPSLLGNIWDRLFHKKWDWKKSYKWYYNQPWEKWADKLGGVKR